MVTYHKNVGAPTFSLTPGLATGARIPLLAVGSELSAVGCRMWAINYEL